MENRTMMNDKTYFGAARVERTNWLNVGALVSFISTLMFTLATFAETASAAGTAVDYVFAIVSAVCFEFFCRKEIDSLCRETRIER